MSFFSKLKQTYQFILKDKVIHELGLNSKFGPGYLSIQIKQQPTGATYLAVKAKGGEATVWVPLEFDEFEKAIEFVKTHKGT